mgnify:CR=1 FL=1
MGPMMGWLCRAVWVGVLLQACVLMQGVRAQADGSGDCALEDVEEEIR